MSFYNGLKPRQKTSQNIINSKKSINNSRYQTIFTESAFGPLEQNQRQLGSSILDRYSQTLEHEVRESEYKRSLSKEKKKQRAMEKFMEQRRSNAALLEELQSLKAELKNQSLEKEYQILKNQRALKMKIWKNHSNNIPAVSQMPYIHSMSMQQAPYSPPPCMPPIHPPYYTPIPNSQKLSKVLKRSAFQQDFPEDYMPKKNLSEIKQKSRSLFYQNKQGLLEPTQEKAKPSKKLPKLEPSKNMKDFQRHHNHDNYLKKLRRCFLAVYFAKCLQKHYLKVINERKKNFMKFWPAEFIKFQQDFQDYFYQKFSNLFQLLQQKSYYMLEPQQSDLPELRDQKRRTIRSLIEVFFSCFKDFKNIKVLGKVAWALCSHLSFVESGVLTLNELDTVSFEPKHRYLRMDKQLQKSQILSLIFMKTLLFQTFLHPWKKWPKYFVYQNKTLVQNMRLLGSILYNLFLTVQDQFIDSSNQEMFQLGNFQQLTSIKKGVKIECSPQLLFESTTKSNELIGGLYSVDELKEKHISMKKFTQYLDEIRETVEKIHEMSCKYNEEFRKKLNLKIKEINYAY